MGRLTVGLERALNLTFSVKIPPSFLFVGDRWEV